MTIIEKEELIRDFGENLIKSMTTKQLLESLDERFDDMSSELVIKWGKYSPSDKTHEKPIELSENKIVCGELKSFIHSAINEILESVANDLDKRKLLEAAFSTERLREKEMYNQGILEAKGIIRDLKY